MLFWKIIKSKNWNNFKKSVNYYLTNYRIYWIIGLSIRPYKIFQHFAQYITICQFPTIIAHIVYMGVNWNLEFVIENAVAFSFHIQVCKLNN